MNRKNATNYEKLARVVEFGKRSVSLFPKDSAAGEILEALDSNVRELSEKTAAHVVAERAMQVSLTARAAARENLRLSIAQAAWVAESIHVGPVRKPVNGSDQALIVSGRGFLKDFGSASTPFAKHGVDVAAAVDSLETAIRNLFESTKSERGAAMQCIKVDKPKLLAILTKNRDPHGGIFLEAQKGFRRVVIEELEKRQIWHGGKKD